MKASKIKVTGKAPEYACTAKGPDVRCECGGQLAIEGSLHGLVDLGPGDAWS